MILIFVKIRLLLTLSGLQGFQKLEFSQNFFQIPNPILLANIYLFKDNNGNTNKKDVKYVQSYQ